MSDEELNIETSHVSYWEDGLNSLSKQFKMILDINNTNYNIQDKRNSFFEQIKSNYNAKCKPFKKEPSHIFILTEIYFDFYSYLDNKMNSETKKLLINTINDIIKNLEKTKNETCNGTLILIDKCKSLIINIKNQEENYKKAKSALDEALIYQKKIKNLDKYTYNVGKKEKADLSLSEKIKEMEKIKIPLEKNKKDLLEYRNELNNIIKNNFEIIISVCFKGLSYYYQCLYLILNQRNEILNNIKGKLDDILIQLSNLVFDMNDYSEKRFGEIVLGIKTEGINIFSSTELINKSSMKQLIAISDNIINYVKIFLICLRYRKKIMKIFFETVSSIIEFETKNIKQSNENKKEFINQLDCLKLINNNCQRFLRNLISKEKINDIIKELNSINSVINNYIEFIRNEYNSFSKNWEPYEENILERKKLSIDFLNEIKELNRSNKNINQSEFIARNEKKKTKLKNAILAGIDFIQKYVISTREKDKNEMMKLESSFEKMFLNCQNINNQFISHTENEINNAVMTDIFEECKIFIIKYFNKFGIQNYENFLERLKIKLLINTDLSQGKFGKIISDRITNEIESQIELSKENNSLDLSSENILPSEFYYQRSRRQSLYLKSEQANRKSNHFISKTPAVENNFENNQIPNKYIINNSKYLGLSNINNNDINNNNKINANENPFLNLSKNSKSASNNNSNEKEKDNINNINGIESEIMEEVNQLSNNDILDELENEDNLQFLTNTELSKYTQTIDPYSNIKEEELDRLLNMKKEDSDKELDDGEKVIDSFSCSLSSEILARGTLIITTKKVEYKSSFLKKIKIIIPLGDIISVNKEKTVGIDNSITIKTEKVTHLFTSFLSRDHCYLILKNQVEIYKAENKKEEAKDEEKDENSPEEKYLKKRRFKAKQITKMLEEIEFQKKLEQITNERMEIISKEYRDDKKAIFLPQSNFKLKYIDIIFEDCPLFIPFYVLCNINSKLEEYKTQKGFFESLFTERGDTEVKFEEIPEFSKNIPQYFNNGDYTMNLFSQFNKEDIENFLNDVQNWSLKYEAGCNAVHKVKKVPFGPSRVILKNRYVAYFVSPTCLIFDDMSYTTGFQFCDNFFPLFRYKFDCKIKFNEYKSKFEFKTNLKILYTTIFVADFWLKSAVDSKTKADTEQTIKGEVIDKLSESLNIYINKFKEIFDRSTEETFQRKIELKQNMITGEIEEEILDGVDDEEKKDEEEKDNKEENKENAISEQNNNNGINGKINEFIEKYKLYILIGIVAITFIEIIHSFFSKGKGTFAINTIFNLIILASIFYLFKFK